MEEKVAVSVSPPVGTEAVELLRELIRLNTVNPPGNEEIAQDLLAETLGDAGFECELLAAEPGRPNLVARLRGSEEGPTLCLLGHVDTVPADPSEWSFDPWAGDVVDGEVRGRGALDMKRQVAAEVAAATALARDGWRPQRGELLVVATADEEKGAHAGAKWLCQEHPDRVRSDLVLNEGGGESFEVEGRRFYTLCVGEKGPCRFIMRARGRAGHASVPALGDNALLKLAPAIERLREQPPLEPTPEGVTFVSALTGEEIDGEDPQALATALERLHQIAPPVATFLAEPMMRVTLAPTEASASPKENVIPSKAEVLVDCRVPPGQGEEEALAQAKAVLGETADGLELEFADSVVGNRSEMDTPLADLITGWLSETDPGATLVPLVMPGFSDSHWFRAAFPDATVYGFCPQRDMSMLEAAPLVHGADERTRVADVELAADFFHHVIREVLG
jgi:acetylornithine deacetylase/succinyl-diaminopimelate desuccinylase-like protein